MIFEVRVIYLVGENPAGYGLPERAGFYEKGLSTDVSLWGDALCKDNTDSKYWSSSENSENNAFDVNFNNDNGNANINNKNNDNDRVRPVLAYLLKPIAA